MSNHDEDNCAKADDEKHKPDWNTITVTHDGDATYVDISCKLCGTSGCVGNEKTLTKDICW